MLHVCSRAVFLSSTGPGWAAQSSQISGPVLGACLDSAQTKMFKAAQEHRGEEGNSTEELRKSCSFVKSSITEEKKVFLEVYQNEPLRFLPYPLNNTSETSLQYTL